MVLFGKLLGEVPITSSDFLYTKDMNAKILEKFILYREINRLYLAKLLLIQKIKYQFNVIKKKNNSKILIGEINNAKTIQNILLIEARAAKEYWKIFGNILGSKIEWRGRKARMIDPANNLLDIGYHYLTGKIVKSCYEIDLPTELGIFHKAQSQNSHPLAYDFMEWLRPIVVDQIFFNLVHKKKKKIKSINQKMISYFIYQIKKKFGTLHYNKKLKYCITLDYWIKLLLLEFSSSINLNKKYRPIFPSLRHENRCKTKPLQSEAVIPTEGG